jgi:hypothetical protein
VQFSKIAGSYQASGASTELRVSRRVKRPTAQKVHRPFDFETAMGGLAAASVWLIELQTYGPHPVSTRAVGP